MAQVPSQCSALAFLALLAAAWSAPLAQADPILEERARARATAARIELEWPIAPAGPVTRFVRRLGARLGASAGRSPFPWRFLVIRDRSANAFSIGAGRIYVNDGTPFACRDEAELAAMLAHEMGHELAGHFRPGSERDRSGRQWLGDAFDARRSDEPELAIGSVRLPIDAEKELEADRISIDVLRRAGYDPHAALSIAELLAQGSGANARHLGAAARIGALERLLASVPPGGRRDSEDFRQLRRENRSGAE